MLKPDTLQFPIRGFIVEVLSESTESRDRGTKFIDYAGQGVVEYWIVDAESETVEQYLQHGNSFNLQKKSNSGRVERRAIVGFVIDIEALFDERKNLSAIRKMID